MRQRYRIIIETLERELEIFPKNTIFIEKEIQNIHKKIRSLLSGLYTYCDQLIVVGFNSHNCGITHNRKYLPPSLQRLDSLPARVIRGGSRKN